MGGRNIGRKERRAWQHVTRAIEEWVSLVRPPLALTRVIHGTAWSSQTMAYQVWSLQSWICRRPAFRATMLPHSMLPHSWRPRRQYRNKEGCRQRSGLWDVFLSHKRCQCTSEGSLLHRDECSTWKEKSRHSPWLGRWDGGISQSNWQCHTKSKPGFQEDDPALAGVLAKVW